MFSDAFFNRVRLDYVLCFDDVIGIFSMCNNPFYDEWFDELFIHSKELIVANQYITTVAALRSHKSSYITDLIERHYKEAVSDLIVGLCDTGDYDCDSYGNVVTSEITPIASWYQNRLDFLNQHEHDIKYNMFAIANNVFNSMFYQIYIFNIECLKRGIRFADLTYKKRELTGCYVVTCHINEEVIKSHDKNWYDRLSLLYSI